MSVCIVHSLCMYFALGSSKAGVSGALWDVSVPGQSSGGLAAGDLSCILRPALFLGLERDARIHPISPPGRHLLFSAIHSFRSPGIFCQLSLFPPCKLCLGYSTSTKLLQFKGFCSINLKGKMKTQHRSP